MEVIETFLTSVFGKILTYLREFDQKGVNSGKMMRQDEVWPFYVRMYVADDVEPPKVPGRLALETKHKTEDSMRMEIQTATDNPEIDVVEYGNRFTMA
jgi:hypothetical protein